MTFVSITVCVRDGVDWVDECIESLIEQTHRPLEIIVVDDGSTDGSRQKVELWQEHELVSTILQEPLGLSAARMAAVNEAKGEWVAITDIDVRPEPDWIENLLLASEPLEGEHIVAITGRTVFTRGDDTISIIRSSEVEAKYRSRSRITTLANGPCSIFRKEELLAIGGFNPEWYHAEDMEVSLKLIAAGGVIIYTPRAIVNHVPETGLMRFLGKRLRDIRAHVRIVRHFPSRMRRGPGFDFIGSSWLVLLGLPAHAILMAALFIIATAFTEGGLNEIVNGVNAKAMAILLMIYLTWFLLLLRNNIIQTMLKRPITTPIVIISWSISLWLGLILGIVDAILQRRGHDAR